MTTTTTALRDDLVRAARSIRDDDARSRRDYGGWRGFGFYADAVDPGRVEPELVKNALDALTDRGLLEVRLFHGRPAWRWGAS